jgi:membrane protease subunit HflK
MPWGDNNNGGGPWGSPGGSSGGSSGGSPPGGGGNNRPPGGPDFDDLVRRSLDSLRDFFPGNSGNNNKTFALMGKAFAETLLQSSTR